MKIDFSRARVFLVTSVFHQVDLHICIFCWYKVSIWKAEATGHHFCHHLSFTWSEDNPDDYVKYRISYSYNITSLFTELALLNHYSNQPAAIKHSHVKINLFFSRCLRSKQRGMRDSNLWLNIMFDKIFLVQTTRHIEL